MENKEERGKNITPPPKPSSGNSNKPLKEGKTVTPPPVKPKGK